MPNPSEVAEIRANGQRFFDWQTVMVRREYGNAWSEFEFTVAEKADIKHGWTALQLKPNDAAQIFLGGVKVIDGVIDRRQTAYNAQSHAVQLAGLSTVVDIHFSQAHLPGGELRNVTFEGVANAVLKPYGFTLRLDNPGSDADRPFDRVSVQRGETVFQMLERLARERNLSLSDDNTGKVVIASQAHGAGASKAAADLVEGDNIKTCLAILDNRDMQQIYRVTGERPPDGDFARSSIVVGAQATNTAMPRFRLSLHQAPGPVTAQDAQALANKIVAAAVSRMVRVIITVQGWFTKSGALWDVNKQYHVFSPMALLDTKLYSKTVTYTQDENGGTQTTLELVNIAGLGGPADRLLGTQGTGGPNASDPMAQPAPGQPAEPLPEDKAQPEAQASYPPSGV